MPPVLKKWIKIGLLVYLIFILGRGLWVNQKVVSLHYRLKQDIIEAQALQTRLIHQKEKLNNPVYLEMLIRQKLGLVKKGEIVYKIIENSKQQ